MSKMVPKVMINMNEYIPSGILGKRVKLDFSKDKVATMAKSPEGIDDYSDIDTAHNLPQILDSDNQWRQLVSGVVLCAKVENGKVFLELNNLRDTNNQQFALHGESESYIYYYLWVTLDQLAQNGGVSWYSKPLATVREKVAA